jgi:hypothetical protein
MMIVLKENKRILGDTVEVIYLENKIKENIFLLTETIIMLEDQSLREKARAKLSYRAKIALGKFLGIFIKDN